MFPFLSAKFTGWLRDAYAVRMFTSKYRLPEGGVTPPKRPTLVHFWGGGGPRPSIVHMLAWVGHVEPKMGSTMLRNSSKIACFSHSRIQKWVRQVRAGLGACAGHALGMFSGQFWPDFEGQGSFRRGPKIAQS